ncbi:CYTH domain-containing protein [Sinomicrobium weinanense]|uniref:CYTH domain-containing protein n=1 Tax=Sinomicrobium weinanense TaxID=2842200 RepID=A0A926Q140_9FLAO|nr:CYTH domain-containing protein [Sinomicrobium weinanense]MBC9794484.1 CYTH domain-containing protein [Sinomicrobium weinanense]MBU3124391.1 CYTH domain-containing protein [Sinomicrobium weinanense]
MIETERKFLVRSEVFREETQSATRIVQGFLNTHPERTVRIRIKGDKGFITVKGKSDKSGLSRFEWEKAISVADAEALLPLCEKGVIEKIRHEIKAGKHLIEVDEFLGENTGLVIAEIELASENEDFYRPDWLGEEVTGDVRYYNSQLSKKPYTKWM